MASAVVGVIPHDGSAATGVTFNSPAALNVLSHSHGCEQMTGLGGSVYVFVNGIRNKSAGTDLKLACALTSPPDGFDIAVDYAGADVNDLSKVASVSVRSCFTARAVPGVGCGTAESTSQAGTGIYGIQVELPEATVDEDAVRYVEVTLPKMDGDAASVLRSFGYYDHSAAIGGGGGGDTSALEDAVADLSSDVTALTATVDGHTASINSLTSTSNAHTGAIADLEAEVSTLLGGVDLSALEDTVAAHTTSINNLDGAVQGHTTQLGMHTTQLTALETSASDDAAEIASINADIALLQSDVDGLQSNIGSAQSEIGTLQTDVLTLQGDMFTTASTVLSHENSINTHTAQLSGASGSGLKTSIDAHSDQLSGITSSGLKTLIGANITELMSHATQLSSHSSDIATLNSQMSGSMTSGLKTAYETRDANFHARLNFFENDYARAFVTSTLIAGTAIGTLSNADMICQQAAVAAGLGAPGYVWRAWLSTNTTSVNSRLTGYNSPYFTTNMAQIDGNFAGLKDGSLLSGITHDENGVNRSGSFAWTGTLSSGATTSQTCSNWTGAGTSGTVGVVGATDGTWTNNGTKPCIEAHRLICFETGS